MPGETARAFTGDGWLRTGDLVTADPGGTYTFVARKKEVLRRRGENLSPAEVEEVLEDHPDVVASQAFMRFSPASSTPAQFPRIARGFQSISQGFQHLGTKRGWGAAESSHHGL
jgi:acyl-CoA synthetase (AMP-forming)/AMP-acid ligase II